MQPNNHYPIIVDNQSHTIHALTDELVDLRLAVKDLFHIKGISTGAGNPHWLNTHPIPLETNSCVLHLLQRGVQYVGKTLTDELAYSLNGQNMHYPGLINPNACDRIVGGSSSGSALAVACDIADIGLGTDTGGSIRVPASYNGLFGLRTSHGAVSTDNMVPLAPSFDTIGWLTGSIKNMLRVSEIFFSENLSASDTQQLSSARLMVISNLVADSEHGSQINAWLAELSNVDMYQTTFDVNALMVSEQFRILQGYDIWEQHGRWIESTQPVFAPDIQSRFDWCKTITKQQQTDSKERQGKLCKRILEMFDNDVDAIVIPTTPGKAPRVNTPASALAKYREDLMGLTAIAGLAGLPQLHLPLFTIDGAACGVSLIGKKNKDMALIKLSEILLQQFAE